jgi:hypothetical protein
MRTKLAVLLDVENLARRRRVGQPAQKARHELPDVRASGDAQRQHVLLLALQRQLDVATAAQLADAEDFRLPTASQDDQFPSVEGRKYRLWVGRRDGRRRDFWRGQGVPNINLATTSIGGAIQMVWLCKLSASGCAPRFLRPPSMF